MKKTTIILGILFATSMLFSQSINANFETDKEGWTSHQSTVVWSNLFAPMNDRGGIRFSGTRTNEEEMECEYGYKIEVEIEDENLFLSVQREVTELSPNTNFRITFNMNWLAWLDTTALPITVKVGANDDFVVAGQLTPNEDGHAFVQNINNFDNAFYAKTDDEGRLFLMIGIETENEKIENVFLNTLRILLREMGEKQEVSDEEISLEEIELQTLEEALQDAEEK